MASEWKEKTAESERTKRIWPRENPISEKMERNKGYLAINSHLKEPRSMLEMRELPEIT